MSDSQPLIVSELPEDPKELKSIVVRLLGEARNNEERLAKNTRMGQTAISQYDGLRQLVEHDLFPLLRTDEVLPPDQLPARLSAIMEVKKKIDAMFWAHDEQDEDIELDET